MRHFREETKEKMEQMEKLLHETNVSQKDHEDKVESQRKEQDEIKQVLLEWLLEVEIQLRNMTFEQRVHNEVEEKKKYAGGKVFKDSRGIYHGH